MDNKEIYMKDLKRAYDVFQWLQINSDNIKKIYDIIKILDYSNYTTKEEFEELVRETPTIVRLVENLGKLQLQLEHDTNVLGIDDEFAPILFDKLFGTQSYSSYFYIQQLDLEGYNGELIHIENCWLVSHIEDISNNNIEQVIREGQFKIIGLNGWGEEGGDKYPILVSYEDSWFQINASQGITTTEFYDLSVGGCSLISLVDNNIIEI